MYTNNRCDFLHGNYLEDEAMMKKNQRPMMLSFGHITFAKIKISLVDEEKRRQELSPFGFYPTQKIIR
jgi:hypothetical protein